jgi:hypothetical protein
MLAVIAGPDSFVPELPHSVLRIRSGLNDPLILTG